VSAYAGHVSQICVEKRDQQADNNRRFGNIPSPLGLTGLHAFLRKRVDLGRNKGDTLSEDAVVEENVEGASIL
jgi:hypothetical protein